MTKKNRKKRPKGKQRKPKRQSLAANSVLFVVSLVILIGASMLMHAVDTHPQLAWAPISQQWTRLVHGSQDRTEHIQTPQAAESTAGAFEYSFYDLLSHQDSAPANAEYHFSIQIAAFKAPERAQGYAETLRQEKKLRCRVVRQGRWSLVQWGSFPTRAAAERYRRKLSEALCRECLVVKI